MNDYFLKFNQISFYFTFIHDNFISYQCVITNYIVSKTNHCVIFFTLLISDYFLKCNLTKFYLYFLLSQITKQLLMTSDSYYYL